MKRSRQSRDQTAEPSRAVLNHPDEPLPSLISPAAVSTGYAKVTQEPCRERSAVTQALPGEQSSLPLA